MKIYQFNTYPFKNRYTVIETGTFIVDTGDYAIQIASCSESNGFVIQPIEKGTIESIKEYIKNENT